MAEAVAAPATPGFNFDVNAITKQLAKGEFALGVGVLALVIMLILPIPAFFLDFLLAISITLSVLILMTSLMMRLLVASVSAPSRP